MKRLYLIGLLLSGLLPLQQAVRADGVNHLAFSETFDVNNGTGGRDDAYSGNIASSNILYDIDGWSGNIVYGGKNCLRFGNSSNTGTCTTPEIILIGTGKTATLTFNAAGWASGTNTLTVNANEGVTLSGDTQPTLNNGTWTAYSVTITMTTATYVQLTFEGKRGFLDDVKVVETVTAINAPTLTDAFTFWPSTTEENATKTITLVPSDSTVVYYTTDSSTPSDSNGRVATLTTIVTITGETTVKAKAYYKTIASDEVTKVYTQGSTVDGIAGLRNLPDETEARVYFADDAGHEARVLYYDETARQLFLRDKTGAVCMDFGTTATFNPTPQYNQHVAGWIVGKKMSVNGMTTLVATENTTTDFLAIADPVTESQTEPYDIDISEINSYLADWVTVSEQRVGTDLAVTDRFGTGAYDGALADLSGIVIPDGSILQMAPVNQNNIPAVVYVIDEQQDFFSPSADIANVTVRLNRTLSSSNWNTFAVPFYIESMEGSIREYDYANGNTMVFKDATSIEAGKPYLVKPTATIENPVYYNVTLSATSAQTITDGGYSFVAIYSPTDLATDKTEQFLKTDGKLYYPTANGTTLRGMRAFFRTPEGQGARLASLDDLQGIQTAYDNAGSPAVYDLQGRRMDSSIFNVQSSTKKKGIYIVNGKKVVIR